MHQKKDDSRSISLKKILLIIIISAMVKMVLSCSVLYSASLPLLEETNFTENYFLGDLHDRNAGDVSALLSCRTYSISSCCKV